MGTWGGEKGHLGALKAFYIKLAPKHFNAWVGHEEIEYKILGLHSFLIANENPEEYVSSRDLRPVKLKTWPELTKEWILVY